MSDYQSSSLPERNPVTYEKHRREVRWQVTLPFILGLLACLALSVLTFFAGAPASSKLADVSLIWLILPWLLVGLITFAILGGLLYAVIAIIRVLPRYTRQVQVLFDKLHGMVRKAGDAAVEPIFRAQSLSARMRALRRNLKLGR